MFIYLKVIDKKSFVGNIGCNKNYVYICLSYKNI